MISSNTEWRNDSAAASASPGTVQTVAGLSPALGARFVCVRSLLGAARRPHDCRASEYQAAVVLASPAVESPRGALTKRRVIDGTPCDSSGCARLRTKRPTGFLFQIQQAVCPAMICGVLCVARALAAMADLPDLVGRAGFFIGGGVAFHDAKNFASNVT